MSTYEALRATLADSLTALAVAREHVMANPEACPAMILGVTHCESCGFSYGTARHVVAHRNRCATPEFHGI